MPSGTSVPNGKLYYTATDPCIFGMNVCNIGSGDAHISVALIQETFDGWEDGDPIPPFSYLVYNLRIEADADDGSLWTMPVVTLMEGDRIVVRSDVGNVTFVGHGFKFSGGG